MKELRFSSAFKRDLKLAKRRGKDTAKLDHAIDILRRDETLPEKFNDHPLIGRLLGFRDCHLDPDWVLIHRVSEDWLYLFRTGTHSDLFR